MTYIRNIEKFMNRYCYLDTCVLSDVLIQYNPLFPTHLLSVSKFLKNNILNVVNKAIESSGEEVMIITSSFSFIELLNKYNEIFDNSSVQPHTIGNFIKQPPLWKTIEDVNEDTACFLCEIPQRTPNGEPISGDDAIHIATAMSRGEPINFCTTDTKINQLNIKNVFFLTD